MRLGAFALCLLVLALAATTVAGCVGRGPSQAQAVSAANGQTVSAAAVAPEQAGSSQAGGTASGQAVSAASQGDSTFEELESTCDDLEAILEILETDSEQDSGL
jgi:hypothetical protein